MQNLLHLKRLTPLIILSIILIFTVLTFTNFAPENIVFAQDEVEKVTDPAATEGCGGREDCNLIGRWAIPFLNFLGAIVGLVVTISIVVGGIQYASSTSDPSKVAAAKGRITNAIIGLVAFLFLYGFLQWLIPGGFI